MRATGFSALVTVLVCVQMFTGSTASSEVIQRTLAPDDPTPLPQELSDIVPELREEAVQYARTVDGFAGVFIDEQQELVFAFKAPDEATKQALHERLDPQLWGHYKIELVRFALSELEAEKEEISAQLMKLPGLEGIGIDVAENGLFVLSSVSPDQLQNAVTAAVGKSSVPLFIERGINEDSTCNDRLNCGGTDNRRAGVSLNRSGFVCTSGFGVLKGSTRYSTTAGHCWYGTNSGSVTSGSQSFGSLNSSNYLFPNSYCDCRLITASNVQNRLYFSDYSRNTAVTSKRTYSNVGDSVRLSGRATQSTGTVQVIDYDYNSPTCNCIVQGSVLASYASTGGDSGGAVSSTGGSIAVGMHSGTSAGYSRYFEVVNIEAQMGAGILTS